MSEEILKKLKAKVDRKETIDDPAAAVVEPEIRTPAQYAMFPTTPDDEDGDEAH